MLREWLRQRRPARPPRDRFVREILPRGGVGVELGVQYGEFTRELLDEAAPKRLHIVDLWYLLGKQWHWGKGDRSTVAALAGILRRFEDELVSGRLVLEIGNDLEVLERYPDRYLDWAYIDSSHDYEHTRRELELLRHKVKPDGVIAGDDWLVDPEHPHGGVRRAVLEFIETEPYELVYASADDLQWALKRR